MEAIKYRILRDYYSEGFKFQDGEYPTVDEAVKAAISVSYNSPFLIVRVIDWKVI